MILLFTDFGLEGPYVGQMTAVLQREAADVPVVNLFADAPAHEAQLSAYLLAAHSEEFPAGSVFLAVVDPGVGGARLPVVVKADGRWFVGPDNGLFAIVARRAATLSVWEITWRPKSLSASFHGRDLFAPVAAMLARGEVPPGRELSARQIERSDWPDDLARVVYIDRFGNAMTGLRADRLGTNTCLRVDGRRLTRARTFSDRPQGDAFWYRNANGLAEIAVNQGTANTLLNLAVGDPVGIVD